MPGLDKKTIVITRPKADAKKLARDLEKKGFNCIIEPILSIKILYENAKSLEFALEKKPQVILVTSKHAVTALAKMATVRNIPILAVGRQTANYALGLGFETVSFASGSAGSLIAYVESFYSPSDGNLLYLRGTDITTDLGSKLSRSDFQVDSVTLYHTQAAHKLSAKLCSALLGHTVDAVTFFSQNTAKTYAKLAIRHNLDKEHDLITAACLSKAIADKTSSLLPWKKVILFDTYIKS